MLKLDPLALPSAPTSATKPRGEAAALTLAAPLPGLEDSGVAPPELLTGVSTSANLVTRVCAGAEEAGACGARSSSSSGREEPALERPDTGKAEVEEAELRREKPPTMRSAPVRLASSSAVEGPARPSERPLRTAGLLSGTPGTA